jgi:hypothetical protein
MGLLKHNRTKRGKEFENSLLKEGHVQIMKQVWTVGMTA